MKRIRLVLLIALTVTGLSVLFLYPEDPARTYRRHVDRGDTYLAAHKYREATVEYRAALKIDPKAGTSRYRLGQAFAAIEDHGNAYREFVRAADLLPEDTDAQLTAVKYLLRAQQFEDARSRVDHLLARQPKLVEAQVLRGSALAGLRDVDGAITQMEEALALDPDRADTYVNLGVLHRARGNNRGAEEVFERALEMDPASVNARLALANYHWSAGRLADAEALIKDAVGVERDGARASRTLAIFYLASGRAADAEQPLRTVAERSADVQPKLMLADYYMAGGRAAQAVAVLESVAKDPRASGLAGARLAAIAYASDKPRGHALVDEVLARDTATPYAHLVKARMLLAEKRYVDAEQQTRAALALDSRTAAAHYLLGTIFLALNNPADAVRAFNEVLAVNPRAVDAQLQLARIHLAHGRKDAAVQFAEQAVKNQPTDGRARLILARALIARGDLRSADAELKLLLAGSAPGAAVHNAIATLHIASGRPDAARAAFERAHALDASDLEALTGLVTFDLQERRVGGAQQRVDAAIAKRATDPRLHMLAAAVRSAAGDAAGAEEALGRAIEADPTQLEAYGLLAQLYIKQDRLTDARLKYEEVARRQPRSLVAHTMVGVLHQAQGNAAPAMDAYQRALAVDTQAAVAANNLAWLYAETGGNLDVALELARTAKRVLPDSAEVSDTLGWIYHRKDLASLAIASLRESVDKDPRNAIYRYHLGAAYARAGQKGEARAMLQLALSLQPQFDGAADARRLLAAQEN